MIRIRKILYATDFSEPAEPACDYALQLTELANAELHVLHVIGELADRRKNMLQPESFAIFEKEIEVHAIREMEALCREKFAGRVNFVSDIVVGIPFQEIIRKAQDIAADLIVIGTHGRTGIEHVIVGSTAERVVRRSPIAVLTVRG